MKPVYFILIFLTLLKVGVCANVEPDGDTPIAENCMDEEPFPDPVQCKNYYQCFFIPEEQDWSVVNIECDSGGYFDVDADACVQGDCPIPKPEDGSGESNNTSDTGDTATTVETPTEEQVTTTTEGPTPSPQTVEVTTTPVPTSTAKPKPPPPKPKPPAPFECKAPGKYPDPSHGSKYFRCVQLKKNKFQKVSQTCPFGLCFDAKKSSCKLFGGCAKPSPAPPPPPPPKGPPPPKPANTPTCTMPGVYSMQDCRSYYRCTLVKGKLHSSVHNCPPNKHFNPIFKLCVKGSC